MNLSICLFNILGDFDSRRSSKGLLDLGVEQELWGREEE